ncbi:MAG: glycosyl transferase family protein [Pseudomonadales bacterium]|nr:glycosyl transferase family protein [Pseudomonadales bacterium]
MDKSASKRTYDEHPFAPYVRILGKGKKGSRSLTLDEARTAMSMILNNEVEELQLGAFLMLLRVKEETPEELAGFVQAAKAHFNAPTNLNVDLDWSSYAGKRRHAPWFLLSIFLLAQNGHRVFIHGAGGHTVGRMYTESVLNELGYHSAQTWSDVDSQLNQNGFSYMPLANLCPELDRMINMRSILGLRSPVHSLSRLLNPLHAKTVLQGIFHPPYSDLHQYAGQILGYGHVAVIKGEGGEIERNPDNDMIVKSSQSGEVSEELWPALFERRHVKGDDISGQTLKEVWLGDKEDEYGEAAVLGTTALALKAMGHCLSQEQALNTARNWWDSRETKLPG